jgi:hypothetical protein
LHEQAKNRTDEGDEHGRNPKIEMHDVHCDEVEYAIIRMTDG